MRGEGERVYTYRADQSDEGRGHYRGRTCAIMGLPVSAKGSAPSATLASVNELSGVTLPGGP
eukprot:903591-Prorocentrum_minimum.AAC.1